MTDLSIPYPHYTVRADFQQRYAARIHERVTNTAWTSLLPGGDAYSQGTQFYWLNLAGIASQEFKDLRSDAPLSVSAPTGEGLSPADEAQMALCQLDWIANAPTNAHPHRVKTIRLALERLATFATTSTLAHPQQGGERDGWKLVPVEPTEEMQAAGWIDKEDVSPKEIYWAMLNAAPTSPSKSPGERDGLTVSTGSYVADEHGTPITGLSWCAAQPHEKTTSHCPACGVGPLEACRGRVPQDGEAPKVSTNQTLADIERNDHE